MAPGIGMIDCSSNELQMLVLKACRGVDLPFAQAQEVASAISASPWAIPDFLEYLGLTHQKAEFDFTNGLEIKNANILRDFSVCADAAQQGVDEIVIRDVKVCPLILALAKYRGVNVDARSNDLFISKHIESKKKLDRYNLDPRYLAMLNKYAAFTYVPETDQSRLDGAGAGLNDND